MLDTKKLQKFAPHMVAALMGGLLYIKGNTTQLNVCIVTIIALAMVQGLRPTTELAQYSNVIMCMVPLVVAGVFMLGRRGGGGIREAFTEHVGGHVTPEDASVSVDAIRAKSVDDEDNSMLISASQAEAACLGCAAEKSTAPFCGHK